MVNNLDSTYTEISQNLSKGDLDELASAGAAFKGESSKDVIDVANKSKEKLSQLRVVPLTLENLKEHPITKTLSDKDLKKFIDIQENGYGSGKPDDLGANALVIGDVPVMFIVMKNFSHLTPRRQLAVFAHEVSHLVGGVHTDENPSRPLDNSDQWETYIEFRKP